MELNEFAATVPSVAKEFERSQVSDPRLRKRVMSISDGWAAAPSKGIPQMARSVAELESTYRLLSNRRVSYRGIMQGHREATAERAREAGTVLVIQDTTEMSFSGDAKRSGLGRLRSNDQGFLAHCALAVSADGSKCPLGLLDLMCWARTGPKRRKANGSKRSGSECAKQVDSESTRWAKTVESVSELVGPGTSLIHVMDREGDSYRLLSELVEKDHRFVIRVARDRCVFDEDDEPLKLSETLCRLDDLVEIEVPLSRRTASPMPGKRNTHPPRRKRTARLAFSAVAMDLKRPPYLTDEPETLDLHFVYVREVDPPDGEEPVAWVLVTTEPIRTVADVTAIIGHYRARWLIEEFFKALKTGCHIEERQLESFAALTNALAIFVPIAWQMLVLRHLSRTTPEAPARAVLSDVQLEALAACAKTKLPPRPNVRDVLFAIAALGGHIKHNGDPGWLTLARGFEQLNIFTAGWSAALSAAGRAPRRATMRNQ
jgi:hypothetical protein